jgi:hypothetical protein
LRVSRLPPSRIHGQSEMEYPWNVGSQMPLPAVACVEVD